MGFGQRYERGAIERLCKELRGILAQPSGVERTAALESATRLLMAQEADDAVVSRACAELGWHDELLTCLARELAKSASYESASLAKLGERIHDATVDQDADVRTLIERTSGLMREPGTAPLVALRLAAEAWTGDPRPPSRVGLTDVVDAFLGDDANAGTLRTDDASGLLRGLGSGIARVSNELAGLWSLHLMAGVGSRAECLARLDAWLARWVSWWEERPNTAGPDRLERTAALAWIESARVLMPHADAGARHAGRALVCLHRDRPSQRRAALGLVAAALPRALAEGEALFVAIEREAIRALYFVESDLVDHLGAADLPEHLPEIHRPASREAIARWGIAASRKPIIRSCRDRSSAELHAAIAGFDVAALLTQSMGDSYYSVSIGRTGAARHEVLSVGGDDPPLIAIHRSGAWVWEQTVSYAGRRCQVHALGSQEPAPWPEHPPRDQVLLVPEILGSSCPFKVQDERDRRFLFAEDVLPRAPLCVVLAPDLAGGSIVMADGAAPRVTSDTLADAVRRALERYEHLVVGAKAAAVGELGASVFVATGYFDLGHGRGIVELAPSLADCAVQAAIETQTAVARGVYGGDSSMQRIYEPKVAVIGSDLGQLSPIDLGTRIVLVALVGDLGLQAMTRVLAQTARGIAAASSRR